MTNLRIPESSLPDLKDRLEPGPSLLRIVVAVLLAVFSVGFVQWLILVFPA